jgi:hypothetical protein
VFKGWTDPDTGLRVLRIHTRGDDPAGHAWSTVYHQSQCFLDGGRKVLLHARTRGRDGVERHVCLLDLTTGEIDHPFPQGYGVSEVRDGTFLAALSHSAGSAQRGVIWDLRTGTELASVALEGWSHAAVHFLGDNRRAIAMYFRRRTGETVSFGPLEKTKYYAQPLESRHYLLTPGEPPRLVLEDDCHFCNHVQGCPTDPELYAYDRWPTPKRDVDQVIHIRSLDGRIHEPARLSDQALRPGDMWGARDHYVWTPDGSRIVSYLCPRPLEKTCDEPGFNHLVIEWWLSALDWRTGNDACAKYPPGRWGGHMQVSPDSRWIVCAGGPQFLKLFLVDIHALRDGWNERVLCTCPRSESVGHNGEPFPYPFVLPDQSGVIFNDGWPGPDHGVYLAEWPKALG